MKEEGIDTVSLSQRVVKSFSFRVSRTFMQTLTNKSLTHFNISRSSKRLTSKHQSISLSNTSNSKRKRLRLFNGKPRPMKSKTTKTRQQRQITSPKNRRFYLIVNHISLTTMDHLLISTMALLMYLSSFRPSQEALKSRIAQNRVSKLNKTTTMSPMMGYRMRIGTRRIM